MPDRDSTDLPVGESLQGKGSFGVLSRVHGGAWRSGLRDLARRALEIVYPPHCIACNGATGEAFGLCPHCWSRMPFIAPPYCIRLGTPFAVDYGADMLSPAAIADPPKFDRARAACVHDGLARELVSRFKYGERLDLARVLGRMMTGAGRQILAEADLIIPVPMHRLRLWRRRYNQAALLSGVVAKQTGLPVATDILLRVKRTRAQVGLRRNERRSNLAGAFSVPPSAAARIAGRRIVLIDDVRTTGSTLNACAHMLRKAGASSIDVLTFTLVPEGGAWNTQDLTL